MTQVFEQAIEGLARIRALAVAGIEANGRADKAAREGARNALKAALPPEYVVRLCDLVRELTTAPSSDDTRLINALASVGAVVRPMVGGGFAFEDQEGEWDGKRHTTWRKAALEALRYEGDRCSLLADQIECAAAPSSDSTSDTARLREENERLRGQQLAMAQVLDAFAQRARYIANASTEIAAEYRAERAAARLASPREGGNNG